MWKIPTSVSIPTGSIKIANALRTCATVVGVSIPTGSIKIQISCEMCTTRSYVSIPTGSIKIEISDLFKQLDESFQFQLVRLKYTESVTLML